MNESDFTALAERARHGLNPSPPPMAHIVATARRTRANRRASLIAGILGLLVIGGGAFWVGSSDEGPPDPTSDQARPLSGSWRLAGGTVDGRSLDIHANYPVTLTVERRDGHASIGGQSACNTYAARVSVNQTAVAISETESTLMGCADSVLDLETAYLQALSEVARYTQTEDRLTLTGPHVELRFVPLAAIPASDLVDTGWRLESITDGEVSSSVFGYATLQLRSNGTFDMSSGCGLVLSGRWVERNGMITFTESSASGGCQQHPQSRAILAVSDSFRVAIDGDQLTVTGRHGGELLYRRASSSDPLTHAAGIAWLLTDIADGSGTLSPTGEPTLRMERDGTFTFTTGCGSTISGTWSERGSMVAFDRSRTLGTCADPSRQVDLIDRDFRGDLLVQLTDTGLSVIAAREFEFVAR